MSKTHHEEVGRAIAADTEAFGFFTSILAGLLLGLALDAWLATGPLLTILGIVLGSVSGFWKLWRMAQRDTEREREHAG